MKDELHQEYVYYGQKTLCIDIVTTMLRKVDLDDFEEISHLMYLSRINSERSSYSNQGQSAFDHHYVVVQKPTTQQEKQSQETNNNLSKQGQKKIDENRRVLLQLIENYHN